MSKTRRQLYLDVCKKAYAFIYENLEDCGFDAEQMSIYIKLENHEFDDEFEFK